MTDQSAHESPAVSKHPWWRHAWVAAVAALVIGIAVGSASAGSNGDAVAPEARAAPTTTVTVSVEREAPPAQTVTVDPASDIQAALDATKAALDKRAADLDSREKSVKGAEDAAVAGTFSGDGTYLVGTDVTPGTYRSAVPTSGNCYWARLASSDSLDIIANNNSAGQSVVEIKASDKYFETAGCEDWHIVQ